MTFLNFFDEKNPQKCLTSHHKAHNYRFWIRFGESRKLVLSQFRAMPHVSQQAVVVMCCRCQKCRKTNLCNARHYLLTLSQLAKHCCHHCAAAAAAAAVLSSSTRRWRRRCGMAVESEASHSLLIYSSRKGPTIQSIEDQFIRLLGVD